MSLDDLSLPELIELCHEILEEIKYRCMEQAGEEMLGKADKEPL